jgi:hypothetical protein
LDSSHPASSPSLYRLSYPGFTCDVYFALKSFIPYDDDIKTYILTITEHYFGQRGEEGINTWRIITPPEFVKSSYENMVHSSPAFS